MTSSLKIFALCVVFHAAHFGHSQNTIVRFERLSNDDGLSSNQVNCIHQDAQGFIWFGTDEGLNKFDGIKITTYKHSIKNPLSLKDNYVDAIVEDQEGKLIIGTSKGVNVFDRSTEQFISLDIEDLPESVNEGNVEVLLMDARANLWVSIEGKGLYQISLTDENYTFYGISKGLASPNVESLSIDRNGVLWAIAGGKLHYFLYDHFESIRFVNNELEKSVITGLIQGEGKSFWIGTASQGLFLLNDARVDGSQFDGDVDQVIGRTEINEIRSIFMDRDMVVWVGIEGKGLVRIENKLTETYVSRPQDAYSLSYNSILSIYQDNAGDLWFGTLAGGVSTIHFTKQNFRNIDDGTSRNFSLSANDVTRISESEAGSIWVGTKTGGINRVSSEIQVIKQFDEDNSFIRNNSVEAVLGAADGTIWLGGWKSGLYQVTESFQLMRSFNLENSELLSDNIFDLVEDKKGNIWVGTIGGGLSVVTPNYEIKSYLQSGIVQDESPIILALDSSQNVLLGGYRGLTIFSPADETSKRYFFKEDLSGISSNTIQCIWVVNQDSIWIGTDDGLNLFSPKNGTFSHYFEEDGLPSSSIKSVLQEQSNLWISTSNGLSKLDLSSGVFRNFSQLDGLQGRQFTSNSFLKSSKGEIYLGGVNGITAFSPQKLLLNASPPRVLITDIRVNSMPIRNREIADELQPVSEIEEIVLQHHESYLSLSFVALNYISSENNQYAYQLEGFDKGWIYTSNPTAFYSNIDPGTYTFRAKASNNNGVWNETGASIKIVILNPWWASWWFRTVYITVILGGIYLFFWLRTRRLRVQKLMLKETVSQRTRQLEERKEALEATVEELKETQTQMVQSEKMASLGVLTAGIAHEINNPLQFIKGGKEIIEKELRKSSNSENKLITRSLESIEEGVLRTGAILQSLNRFNRYSQGEDEMCDLQGVIENCLLILNHDHQGRIKIQQSYPDSLVVKGNEGELHQAFLNILKNSGQAIKEKGVIKIDATSSKEGKQVVIEDSGVGIDQETISRVIEPFFTTKEPGGGPGLGLAISYRIIKKHNGELSFESAPGHGTKVTVRFSA